jgi:hypothetical protein
MGIRVSYTTAYRPVVYSPTGIEFGNTDQEYDIDGTTWISAVEGGALGGIPDEAEPNHALADCLTAITTPLDGSVLAVREGTGIATATNPMTVEFLFTNVPRFDTVDMRLQYTGSAAHDICIFLWDYANSTFVCNGTFSDQVYQTPFSIKMHGASNYVGTGADAGKVILELRHLDTGNAGHRFDVDYIAVVENG